MLSHAPLSDHCDLQVPPLCLGTMNFGEPGKGHQSDWTIGPERARPIIERAIELGLNYFDCADTYGGGACERVVGQLLSEMLPREQFVFATKIGLAVGKGSDQRGLTHDRIIRCVDDCLQRTGFDYLDQLIIHRHPHFIHGHPPTPIEECLEALHKVIGSGKVRYLGASTMFAWQFAELQWIAEVNGWTKFISMQNHYNLVYREEEREMNPFCASHGIALSPWSPLARGILTGSYEGSFEKGSTTRSEGRDRRRTERLYQGKHTFRIAKRVGEVAQKTGNSAAQIAMAWLVNKPEITAPVVGVSKIEQLDQLAAATQIKLAEADVAYLEELYQPVDNLLSLGYS